jgi:hypothetical protein
MSRLVVIGNAGGGKSTLARKLAEQGDLRHIEIDRLLWQPGWKLTPSEIYDRQHDEIIQGDNWIIDGLGRQASIPRRFKRATAIVLIDMPLWMHFWLAADRQVTWATGNLQNAPGGIAEMPPTKALFQNIWEVEQTWMPDIRILCANGEKDGKSVIRVSSVDGLTAFDGRELLLQKS